LKRFLDKIGVGKVLNHVYKLLGKPVAIVVESFCSMPVQKTLIYVETGPPTKGTSTSFKMCTPAKTYISSRP
jgi:hypothetical protein